MNVEELLQSEKVKTLEPKECGLIYDEEKHTLIGVCNENGKIKVTFKKKIKEI